MLVNSYLRHERPKDSWPPLKMIEFVHLNLVQQDTQAYHIGLKTVQKNIDEVYGKKINIKLQDVFQEVDNGSQILFEGRPGSGKTTLMVKATCDWARGVLFQSKIVVFVRLRHLPKSADIDLHDLLRVACPAFKPDDIKQFSGYIEGSLGENIVFVLDGFDEYAPRNDNDNYVSRIVSKIILPQSIVVLSSRPAATQHIREDATLWIEVVGFMKEQVLQYINSCFKTNKEKCASLIKHLEEHQNLMNICYLPLHCAMLVHIYRVDGTLAKTETEFYRDFTLSHFFRGIRKQTGPTRLKLKDSFDSLPDKQKNLLGEICKLAFKATVESRQVLDESEVNDIYFNDSLGSDELLVIDQYFAKFGDHETSYTFLHLTLQEFLSAVYISRLEKESEQISIVTTYSSEENLFVVWRFLLGMLDYSKESAVKIFHQILKGTCYNHLLHFQCARESQNCDLCSDVVRFHKNSLSFNNVNNPSDFLTIVYGLRTAQFDAKLEQSFSQCTFSVENSVALLKGLGNHQVSLTIQYVIHIDASYVNMF